MLEIIGYLLVLIVAQLALLPQVNNASEGTRIGYAAVFIIVALLLFIMLRSQAAVTGYTTTTEDIPDTIEVENFYIPEAN